jgi:hypothetical protein
MMVSGSSSLRAISAKKNEPPHATDRMINRTYSRSAMVRPVNECP